MHMCQVSTIGSLMAGKRTDIVMVRTTDLNMLSMADTDTSCHSVSMAIPPMLTALWSMAVGGKFGGSLIGIDTREIGKAAARAHKRIRGMASG